MSLEDQLAKELEAAPKTVALSASAVSSTTFDETAAKRVADAEQTFYDDDLKREHIADLQSARTQREEYARNVFILVALWIGALFIILLKQGESSDWHPFSDKVLIALICSMTVNLIGTLVIVLKYIFR